MWPDCSSPRRFPAPRMSRSCEASSKPAPRLSSDCSTFNRRSACAVTGLSAGMAAQLVELRQPKAVGAMYDQRIRGRNVEARLDDGRGQENIELSFIEGAHDVLELARRYLAVSDGDLYLRHVLFE